MLGIATLLTIVTFGFLVVRVGTVALMMTGLSREVARFQALSAYTGVGFTTQESETVTRHPARRQIIRALILLGNMGIVTAVSTAILSFAGIEQRELVWVRLLVLAIGLAILWAIACSRPLEVWMSRWIERLLAALTDLELRDYLSLLRLDREYSVAEIVVDEDSWLAGRPLAELGLDQEGVAVLGVVRGADQDYIGAPQPALVLQIGDIVIVYGQTDRLRELAERTAGRFGDDAHSDAVRAFDRTRQVMEERGESQGPSRSAETNHRGALWKRTSK